MNRYRNCSSNFYNDDHDHHLHIHTIDTIEDTSLLASRSIMRWFHCSCLFLLCAVFQGLHFTSAVSSNYLTQLTCQGTNYDNALKACPDGGAQKMSNGGNVTIFVKRAHNLPNRDNTGAAGVSDPYVKFSIGNVGGPTFTSSSFIFGPQRHTVTASTRTISNNLNPVWNEYVSLGYLGSATLIQLEIWDSDSGLEFADDLLVSAKVRVPFCSTFSAKEMTYNCEGEQLYGRCEVSDSLWRMPSRKVCNETASINFTPTLCSSSSSMCLDIEFHIVPFIVQVRSVLYHCVP